MVFVGGEAVTYYVTPTPPPNPDCPDGLPCQTLQYYFNSSLIEERIDLTMIFLTGHHAGVCGRTVLKSVSFNVTGVSQGVTVNCTYIELRNATAINFEKITLDHWYISSPCPPVLVFQMSSVVVQNQTHIHIIHATYAIGNFIGLRNCFFRNSLLSGTLYLTSNRVAMVLNSSTLNIGSNTKMSFVNNSADGAMALYNSTLNIGSDSNLIFINNSAVLGNAGTIGNNTNVNNLTYRGGAMTLISSTLNIENDTNVTFINNSAVFVGGAVALISSILITGSNTSISYINNSALQAGGAMYLYLSTLNIEKDTKIALINNSAVFVGGAACLISSTLIIRNDVFMSYINNIALKDGGAVYLHLSTLTTESHTNITLINNLALGDGGAMFLGSSTMKIGNDALMTFINNSALEGGAVALYSSSKLNIKNNTFTKYSAVGHFGGAMALVSSKVITGRDTTLTYINNTALKAGGAMYVSLSKLTTGSGTKMTFINNSARVVAGGAAYLILSTLNVGSNANVACINSSAGTGGGGQGGAMYLTDSSILNIGSNATVAYINSSARVGRGGAICVSSSSKLNIESDANVTFIHNSAIKRFGGAMALYSSILNIGNGTYLTFTYNSAVGGAGGAIHVVSSIMNTGTHTNMTFISNSAIGGTGGAISLFSSMLNVGIDTVMTLINNLADRGGAMALQMSSTLNIASRTNMKFVNNTAMEFGGAIDVYPDQLQLWKKRYVETPCFYHNQSSNTGTDIFHFINNSATIAGHDTYGTSLSLCPGAESHVRITINNTGLSSVSGDPTRVCKCDEKNQPQCHDISYVLTSQKIYPGETFTIPVVVVGGDWGTTPGTVHASFRHYHTSQNLKPFSQYNQWLNTTQCTSLKYTVYGNETVQLMLSANTRKKFHYCGDTITNYYNDSYCNYSSPVYIHLTSLSCPPGFSLQGEPPGCDCYPVLTDNGVKCNITDGKAHMYFLRRSTLWFDASEERLVYENNCPYGYCKITKVINSSVPCAFNHAGRLCGGCKENYSLAIGSSHCIYCPSNNNLALLIFFAAAGFLLVFLISVLNLTITQGMINGLIFYANIVWAYQSILFPQQMQSELVFFKTFIAWLNLDFGIETCFVRGLNAFWKTWLQFVFPFYVWSIVGLMMVTARRSTKLTNLLGDRAVPVLTTLILLSYMKLLRTVMVALEFSILTVYFEQHNTTTIAVWSVDGTLDYFGFPHILLFVAAVLTLLFLWLPYTLLLLLMQWLRRISHFRLFKWTAKLNPFYDACFAPLKVKHQYWFGVLLLVRGMILVTFASTFAIPQTINLLILLVFAGVLLFYVVLASPYKTHTFLAFQSSFFLNLALLSGFIIYTKGRTEPTTQAAVVGLSTGVVFLQFCFVILHSIYTVCYVLIRGKKGKVSETDTYDQQEQIQAILDINYRPEDPSFAIEDQPLLTNASNTPTY